MINLKIKKNKFLLTSISFFLIEVVMFIFSDINNTLGWIFILILGSTFLGVISWMLENPKKGAYIVSMNFLFFIYVLGSLIQGWI